MQMGLSSPNRIVWQYFEALRRRVYVLGQTSDDTVLKQDAAICIMLAVTVVEAFLNVFFRVVVSEQGFMHHEQRLLKDFKSRRSLDYKLKNWPPDILGSSLELTLPTPKAFMALKERRNALMHFTSSHETINVPGATIQGLADTTAFDSLTARDAADALAVAEGMVSEVFRLKGITEEQLPYALQLWTGKVPI